MYSGSLWQKNCGLGTGRRDRRKPLFYAVFIFYNNNLPMHLLYNQNKGGEEEKKWRQVYLHAETGWWIGHNPVGGH